MTRIDRYKWYLDHEPDSFYVQAILRMLYLDVRGLMPRFELPYVLLANYCEHDANVVAEHCPIDVLERTHLIVGNFPKELDEADWEEEERKLNLFWFPNKPHDIKRIRKGVLAWQNSSLPR
ncbi:MAG: hypothetical protein R3C18_01905 [Planctomycetaceae bacterium]